MHCCHFGLMAKYNTIKKEIKPIMEGLKIEWQIHKHSNSFWHEVVVPSLLYYIIQLSV